MPRRFLFALALVCGLPVLPAPAAAQTGDAPPNNWALISQQADGSTVQIRVDSIREHSARRGRRFDVKEAWFGWTFASDDDAPTDKFLTFNRFDCENRRIMLVANETYAPDGTLLNSYQNEDDKAEEYLPVLPNSIEATMLNYVCVALTYRPVGQ